MRRELSLLRQLLRMVRVLGLASVAVAHIALADPAPEPQRACPVATLHEAGTLADTLFDRGEYQQAGVCYQAAGDMARANLAFLKAAGPESEDTARALKAQRDAAKSLFATVEHAFRGNH
jgi:hypothetical protein